MENTQNTPKRSGGKISYTLQAIGLIPLLALGIVMLFFTSQWFTKTMYQEVERELYDATKSATTLLNAAYPGDYRLEGDVAYLLYKGDVDITREYSLFDQFKEDTGLDITLFYQDTRILTTLYNAQGDRIVGSGAPDVVIRDVLNTGEDHFYINTLINGKTYFSYYSPVRNQDGSARWGTEKDIKPFVDPKFENNVILTGTEFLTMNTRPKIPANARNLNCCIIGSSGSGKTRFWLTPQLLQAHSSYVVVDPKGYNNIGQRKSHTVRRKSSAMWLFLYPI